MKIKEFLNENNWTKGIFFLNDGFNYLVKRENWTPENYKGKCCLIGAIELCYNDEDQRYNIEHKLLREIRKEKYREFWSIRKFNDSCETNFLDVKQIVEKLDI